MDGIHTGYGIRGKDLYGTSAWVTKIHPVLETAQYRGVWVLGEVEVKTKQHTLANLIYIISSR